MSAYDRAVSSADLEVVERGNHYPRKTARENRSNHRSRRNRVVDAVRVWTQTDRGGGAAFRDGGDQQAVGLLTGFERALGFPQLHSERSRKLAIAIELLQGFELIRRHSALLLLVACNLVAVVGVRSATCRLLM